MNCFRDNKTFTSRVYSSSKSLWFFFLVPYLFWKCVIKWCEGLPRTERVVLKGMATFISDLTVTGILNQPACLKRLKKLQVKGKVLPSSDSGSVTHRSTKGASKARRDQMNGEIRNMRTLLPIPQEDQERLSYLHSMSVICTYIRKSVLYKGEGKVFLSLS